MDGSIKVVNFANKYFNTVLFELELVKFNMPDHHGYFHDFQQPDVLGSKSFNCERQFINVVFCFMVEQL